LVRDMSKEEEELNRRFDEFLEKFLEEEKKPKEDKE